MHLKISARFTLQNLPKGYLGLRGTNVAFGGGGPVELWRMCARVIGNIIEWYLIIDPAGETVNENIKRLIEWLESLEIKPAEPVKDNQQKLF